MKKIYIGRGLLILLLASVCVLSFVTSRKADTAKSASATSSQLIDTEDMEQGEYYFFWDHGSGTSVAQYDRMENDNIYTTYSITPAQSLFSINKVFTVYEAGNIRLATLPEILHLLECIIAGAYVP